MPHWSARNPTSRLQEFAVNFRRGFAYGAAVLGEPITVAGALAAVQSRLRARADVFLDVVERAIFGTAGSPYRPLLTAAGYDLARVRTLIRQHGVEAALQQLCRDGVYVSIEEYKGLREARRGPHVFRFHEREFHNPSANRRFARRQEEPAALGPTPPSRPRACV